MKDTIVVTGCAGFIGFHVASRLIKEGYRVIGFDIINDYYSTKIKRDRIKELKKQDKKKNFIFYKINLINYEKQKKIFIRFKPKYVVNLAAQAGVRYSLKNPMAYVESNLIGFTNILELCRHFKIKHLIYASTSSVYGASLRQPYQEKDVASHPVAFYGATKRANELMAHSYSYLYKLPTTGLRFFTVYGPWGRPDMAYYLFAEAISNDKSIKVFNNGEMERDFTYIDDIVNGVTKIIEKNIDSREHYKIYNIGNNKTESLHDFITTIEEAIGKKAIKEMYPMQQGDVPKTFADVNELIKDYKYSPSIDIKSGIQSFVKWFKTYKL